MGSNFGLGIILSFTDKASAGINGAVVSLNGLNNAVDGSVSKLDTVGSTLKSLSSLGAGMTAAITAPVAGFVGKITQYGMGRASYIENAHLAFTSLIGDEQKASDYMQDMLKFAGTSAYAYEDIATAAQNMISSGIDKLDVLKQKSDGTWTGILQAIGDAAGATGSGTAGFQSMAMALGNIKAEGKASGIRIQQLQRYGIQASKIIGNLYNVKEPEALEKIKSMSADQFIADLTKGIEEGTKGLNGATGKMAGQMLKMQDTYTGAKENLIFALKTAGLELMGGYEDSFGIMRYKFEQHMSQSINRLGEAIKNIAPMFQPLVTFFDAVVTGGSKALVGVTKAFSMLSPTLKGVIGLVTTFLTLMGPGLLIAGKVLAPVLEGWEKLSTLLAGVNIPIKSFAVSSIIAYTAWKSNFLGIRDLITSFVSHLGSSFDSGRKIAEGSVDSVLNSIDNLRNKGDFWSNLTIGFTKLSVVGKSLIEMFNSKDGLTLSAETWEKARVLGILPFIEGIQDIKYRFDNFKEGFKKGWESVANAVKSAFGVMNNAVKGTFLESAIENLGKFFKAISNNDPDSWQKLGNITGKIAPMFLSVAFALKMLHKVSSPFAKISSLLPPIFSKKDGGGEVAKKELSSGFLSSPKSVVKSMGNLAMIIIGTALIVSALGMISKVPHFNNFLEKGAETMTKLFNNIVPIVAVTGSLGLITAGFNKIGNAKDFAMGIANFAILLGGIQLLITAMGALNSIPHFSDFLDNGVETIGKITSVMQSLANPKFLIAIGAVTGLGVIGGAGVALSGMTGLATIIGGLTAIITAFGALNKIPDIQTFIEGGGDLLAKIFEQVGKIGGAVVKGLSQTVVSGLPDIGTDLSTFATNVKPFLTAFQGVDASGIGTFAKGLGEMLYTLSKNNILEFFGGEVNLGKIATDLASFGTNIKPFLDSMADVDDANITKASNVMQMLGNLSGYELKSGGLLQKLTGEVDISGLGGQLIPFAEGIKGFLDKASEIDENSVSKGQSVLNLLQAMSGYSLKSGGLLQKITGEVDLSSAGTQLSNFVTNASGFFTGVQSIDSTALTNGKNVIDLLSQVATINGGDIDVSGLASAGLQLSRFAENVKGFYTNASTITDFSAGDKLVESASKASTLNSLASGGGSNLVSYGQGLTSFATSWNTFTTTFKGGNVSTAGLTAMSNALQNFGSKLTTVNNTVKTQLQTMVATVKTQLNAIKTAFSNTTLKLAQNHISVPHFSMSGKFNPKSGSTPTVSVDWYAKGGIFDSPSLIGVGESGKEAVVPLERNTEWITLLANKLGSIINSQTQGVSSVVASLANSFVGNAPIPEVVGVSATASNEDAYDYVRSRQIPVSTGNSQVVNNSKGNTKIDNSVNFASGSIVVNVQNASEEEAERLANSIIEKISWKQKMEAIRNFTDLSNEIPVFDI